jgi:integrase/recombinase XerD
MKLYFATDDLVRDGRSFERLPLLLNDDCTPSEPAQTFLWHVLVEGGGVTSKLTWVHYGRWLFDYFQFLQQNDLVWNPPAGPRAGNPLSRYRQWALTEVGSSRRTVNLYTGLVRRFYEWAYKHGYIDYSPLTYYESRTSRGRGLLAHLSPSKTQRSSIALREHGEIFEYGRHPLS